MAVGNSRRWRRSELFNINLKRSPVPKRVNKRLIIEQYERQAVPCKLHERKLNAPKISRLRRTNKDMQQSTCLLRTPLRTLTHCMVLPLT